MSFRDNPIVKNALEDSLFGGAIKKYKDETEINRKQLEDAKNQLAAEQRRVQEKQINHLRRNYRPSYISVSPGNLGIGQPASEDINTKLGG